MPRNTHAADAHGALGAILDRVQGSGSPEPVADCLRFIAHTAVRSAEARGARWGEFDLDAATWAIPAGRTKMGREHKVPLSAPVVALLRRAHGYRLRHLPELVFPSRRANGGRGGMLQDTTLARALRDAGGSGTVHGLRTAFRSWCAESGVSREVAESALAHVVKGTEGAYMRSDLFDLRAPLMAEWSAYLSR